MRVFSVVYNIIAGIQRVLRDMRGAMDNELLAMPQQVLDSLRGFCFPKYKHFSRVQRASESLSSGNS